MSDQTTWSGSNGIFDQSANSQRGNTFNTIQSGYDDEHTVKRQTISASGLEKSGPRESHLFYMVEG